MYRPEGLLEWNKKTHDMVENLGPLPPQTEFPIVVPDTFYWRILRRRIFEAGADAMGIRTACLVLNIMFYKVPSIAGDKSGEWWESELRDKRIPIRWDRELGEFIPEE